MDASKELKVLKEAWIECERCDLARTRRKGGILFGQGPYNADYLVITDAPSEDDMMQGYPMSDSAGQLVIGLLNEAGIGVKNNVFFTSAVGCRPFTIVPATEEVEAREQDREPTKEELQSCHPRLNEIAYLVDPRIIIAMGPLSWKSCVLPKDRQRFTKIASAAGEIFDAWIHGRVGPVRYPVMATLSAGQIIKNPSSAAHAPLAATLESLIKAARYVESLKKEERK